MERVDIPSGAPSGQAYGVSSAGYSGSLQPCQQISKAVKVQSVGGHVSDSVRDAIGLRLQKATSIPSLRETQLAC